MKRLFILLLSLLPMLGASADNTLRGGRLRPAPKVLTGGTTEYTATAADTLREPAREAVELSGYDKPLRSSRETFLLTNHTGRPIDRMAVTISYYDINGRQLHERCDTLPVSVPSEATRLVRLATWDTQRSYYYHLGQRPRTSNVTPYTIRARIGFVTFAPER